MGQFGTHLIDTLLLGSQVRESGESPKKATNSNSFQ